MDQIKRKCKRGQREALLRFLEKLHGLSIALGAAGIALNQESKILDEELDNVVLSKKYNKHGRRLLCLSLRIGRFVDNAAAEKSEVLTL